MGHRPFEEVKLMEKGWLLFVFLVVGITLLSACTTRTTDLPGPPLIPVGEPTQASVQPTQAPVQPTQAPVQSTQPSAPQPTVNIPSILIGQPEFNVIGTLDTGVPFGQTAEGLNFKGNPEAPVIIVEFSEYQ
jgi:hypothetical protein